VETTKNIQVIWICFVRTFKCCTWLVQWLNFLAKKTKERRIFLLIFADDSDPTARVWVLNCYVIDSHWKHGLNMSSISINYL